MKEKIDKFIEYFTTITKEEADYIESIMKWDEETKMAFMLAKNIFENRDEHEERGIRTLKKNEKRLRKTL